MLRGQTCCQLCFLLHFVYCGNTALSGTFCIRRGQLSVPAPRCLIPETSDRSFRYHTVPSFSQWLTHSGPALITLTPFFFSSIFLLGYISFFSVWEPEATLCVSQMKHLTSLLGVFYFGHCCRKLSVKCAPGAAVCSSIGLLWGTGHADCPYGAPTHLCSENINTWWVMICLFLLIYHILDLKSSNKKNCCTWHLCKMLSTIHIFQRKPVVATVIMMDATEEGR